ncbi:ComF family protein [Fusobacterium sp.]|uniref:ComF family protein n=1 Tax=Fusobacterium sp. TaxID=68766 RepID=UPI00396C8FE1
MLKIHPMLIEGNWKEGYVLDYFMLKSIYEGEDIFGYPIFDVEYSEIGKLMNALKYHKEYAKAADISKIAVDFIRNTWKIEDRIDGIIATPPAHERTTQPLFQIVQHLGEALNKPISLDFFRKLTPDEIKALPSEKKVELFKNSISKERKLIKKGNILLVDDLYSTGATLRSLCSHLADDSLVENIYVLVICKNIKSE